MPIYGDVAQLGEHHVRNVGVEGSSPFISTMFFYAVRKSGVFFAFGGEAQLGFEGKRGLSHPRVGSKTAIAASRMSILFSSPLLVALFGRRFFRTAFGKMLSVL